MGYEIPEDDFVAIRKRDAKRDAKRQSTTKQLLNIPRPSYFKYSDFKSLERLLKGYLLQDNINQGNVFADELAYFLLLSGKIKMTHQKEPRNQKQE